MAILAVLYGIISGHGIWYPINLLSAGFFPARATVEQIAAFHWDALIIATILHLICSSLVGLLYGVALPMFPRRPILFGGLIAPVLWSGLIHSMLDAIDPVLNQRIDWPWFVISQLGFGIVAGVVVSRQERIRTWQFLPFAMRAGIETQGAVDEKNDEKNEEKNGDSARQ
jgi:formate-dependent nitrite reductase membrane component NrfD